MDAVVTGATGFIGSALVGRLGGKARVLTRDAGRAAKVLGGAVEAHRWEPAAGPAPAAALEGAGVVFNLMGDPIAKGRWNPRKTARIRESRVTGTRNLVAGIEALPAPRRPRALVSASAIGFYGERGEEELDETSGPGHDFLAGVCREWEFEARRAEALGVRVVCIRNGVVLRREGGALAQMLPPFRFGLGGRLGTGRQWMAWIHLEDLLALYLAAAERSDLGATLNGVAPNPVRNAEFTAALAAALRRPAVFPVPAPAIRLAFGGVAEVMLASQRVFPKAALRAGFSFRFPDLPACLAAALAG